VRCAPGDAVGGWDPCGRATLLLPPAPPPPRWAGEGSWCAPARPPAGSPSRSSPCAACSSPPAAAPAAGGRGAGGHARRLMSRRLGCLAAARPGRQRALPPSPLLAEALRPRIAWRCAHVHSCALCPPLPPHATTTSLGAPPQKPQRHRPHLLAQRMEHIFLLRFQTLLQLHLLARDLRPRASSAAAVPTAGPGTRAVRSGAQRCRSPQLPRRGTHAQPGGGTTLAPSPAASAGCWSGTPPPAPPAGGARGYVDAGAAAAAAAAAATPRSRHGTDATPCGQHARAAHLGGQQLLLLLQLLQALHEPAGGAGAGVRAHGWEVRWDGGQVARAHRQNRPLRYAAPAPAGPARGRAPVGDGLLLLFDLLVLQMAGQGGQARREPLPPACVASRQSEALTTARLCSRTMRSSSANVDARLDSKQTCAQRRIRSDPAPAGRSARPRPREGTHIVLQLQHQLHELLTAPVRQILG